MYDIEDYYDIEYRNKPYQSALEELGDWQRLLDMLLEGYLEQKKRGSERKLFSMFLLNKLMKLSNQLLMTNLQRNVAHSRILTNLKLILRRILNFRTMQKQMKNLKMIS